MKRNISSLILVFILLLFWQGAAMGIHAAYILPSPTQILVRLWELRTPLFLVHLPATMGVTALGLCISVDHWASDPQDQRYRRRHPRSEPLPGTV